MYLARLFQSITESAATSPAEILSKWSQLKALPHAISRDLDNSAQREIAERNAVRQEIQRWFSAISDLAIDSDSSVAAEFQNVVGLLSS